MIYCWKVCTFVCPIMPCADRLLIAPLSVVRKNEQKMQTSCWLCNTTIYSRPISVYLEFFCTLNSTWTETRHRIETEYKETESLNNSRVWRNIANTSGELVLVVSLLKFLLNQNIESEPFNNKWFGSRFSYPQQRFLQFITSETTFLKLKLSKINTI